MWTLISDCGKELTVQSRLREKSDGHVKVYDIIEVEFDQYKLKLITKDDLPVAENLRQILTCEDLVRFNFEVEKTER